MTRKQEKTREMQDKIDRAVGEMAANFQDAVVEVMVVKTLEMARRYKAKGIVLGRRSNGQRQAAGGNYQRVHSAGDNSAPGAVHRQRRDDCGLRLLPIRPGPNSLGWTWILTRRCRWVSSLQL